MKKFTAVVTTSGDHVSRRRWGDWACFLGSDVDEAIEKALEAKAAWEANGYGPYTIYVGALTDKVAPLHKYKLTPLWPKAKTRNKKQKTKTQ